MFTAGQIKICNAILHQEAEHNLVLSDRYSATNYPFKSWQIKHPCPFRRTLKRSSILMDKLFDVHRPVKSKYILMNIPQQTIQVWNQTYPSSRYAASIGSRQNS